MSDRVVIILDAEDEFSAELGALISQLKESDRETQDLAAAQDQATTAQRAWTAATKGGALALGGLSAAVGLAGAAIVGVLASGQELLEVWREQEGVNNRLAQALLRNGVAQEKVNAEVARYSAIAGEAAGKTMFGDEDVFRGLERFISLTGQARVEQSQLSVILGLATSKQTSTAQAAELYAKALKGEVGPLKDLTTLTKEQEAALNKMTDATARAAAVQEILSAQFGGLAEAVNPTFNAIKNQQDVIGDLQQALGGLIDTSGAVPAVLAPITAELRGLETWIGKNDKTARLLTIAFIDGLVVAIDELLVAGAEGVKILVALKTGGELLAMGFDNAALFVQQLGDGVIAFVTGATATALRGLEGFAGRAVELAKSVGADELAERLERGVARLSRLRASAEVEVDGALKRIGDSSAKMDANIDKGADALLGYVSAADKVDEGLARVRKTTGEIRDNLAKARKEIEAGRISEAPKTTKPAVTTTTKKLDGAAGADAARAEAVAKLRLDALTAVNERTRIDLELQAKLKEIEGQRLGPAREKLATAQAELSARKELAAIEKAEAAAVVRLDAERLRLAALKEEDAERRVALEYQAKLIELNAKGLSQAEYALALERLRREEASERAKAVAAEAEANADALDQMAARLRAVGAANDDVEKVGASLGGLAELVSKITRQVAAVQSGSAKAGEAALTALDGAGSVLTGVFAKLGASTRSQALLQGAFAQAQALLAFFTGDPIRGAGLQAAAAAHFAVAAKAGGGAAASSVTSAGGFSGGSGAAAGGASTRAEDAARGASKALAADIAEALGSTSAPLTINFNGGFYGSDAEQEITDMVDREQRRRGLA